MKKAAAKIEEKPAVTYTPQHKLFTTHEVAQLLQVDASTVSKWIDKKILLAFRTPGGHRRVQAQHLVAFVKHFQMPVPVLLELYKDQEVPGPTPEAVKLVTERESGKSMARKRAHK
jgi:excisionase family DNA binding protein